MKSEKNEHGKTESQDKTKNSEVKESKTKNSEVKESKTKNSEVKESKTKNSEVKESIEESLKISQDKLLRAMAEIENQRRRFEKEKQEAFDFGGFNFAAESLPLIDNIDRAISSFKSDDSLKDNKDLDKIIDGIEIVKKDLVSIFKKNGIEPISCINKKFDPNFHQAMLEVDDNTKDPGTVVQEMQTGYMMKSRLLRPSLVSVAKKRNENKDKK